MKKLVISAIAAVTLLGTSSTIAFAHKTQNAPNAAIIKMFAKSQDMNEHQQDLAVNLFKQFKSLASAVKSPEDEIKSYMQSLIERDSIDVQAVMERYRLWQQNVDKEFEQSLIAAAELHADLTPEQRKNIVTSIKSMRSKKDIFTN